MKVFEREQARDLRRKGKSINQIVREAGLSKASVSIWVRDIVLTETQKKKISEQGRSVESIERRRINRLFNEKQKRQIIIDEATKDIDSISLPELKIIGSMLYWAEGRKRGQRTVGFSNSDPDVIRIMMKFFRKLCGVEEGRFRGHIHIHSHLNVNKAEKYWSEVTNIPRKQFYKTYSKPSISSKGKFDHLPYGTFDLCVCDTRLFLTIMGWIQKIKTLILK